MGLNPPASAAILIAAGRQSAPEPDSGALAGSAMDNSRAPDTRSEWSTDWPPNTAASTSRLVRCSQPVVSGTDCPPGFVGSLCLVAQGLDGDAVHLSEEFPGDRLELFQDSGGFVKLCAGPKILQVAREIARDRRKLRKHAAAFVSRFPKAKCVLVVQCVSDRRQVLRDSRLERLTHFPEQCSVPPAGRQQHRRVEQVRAGGWRGDRVLRTRSMAAHRSAGRTGLVRKSSMPAARQRSRSSFRERAVKAMTGK